jgi:hypothetical protein
LAGKANHAERGIKAKNTHKALLGGTVLRPLDDGIQAIPHQSVSGVFDMTKQSNWSAPGNPADAGGRSPRRNVDAMAAARPGVYDRPDTIRRKDIHDKWSKISDEEANRMTGKPDLVALLQSRYGLSAQQAQTDVDAWAKNLVF